jgi:hypothetical protein
MAHPPWTAAEYQGLDFGIRFQRDDGLIAHALIALQHGAVSNRALGVSDVLTYATKWGWPAPLLRLAARGVGAGEY